MEIRAVTDKEFRILTSEHAPDFDLVPKHSVFVKRAGKDVGGVISSQLGRLESG